MFTISIDPVVFTIGHLTVRWYGIMVSIGVLVLLVVMLREAKRLGIPRDISSIFFWGFIGGIVGARLAFVIYDWEHFVANPRDIIGLEGLAQNGMIIGIIAAALIYMGVTKMRFSTLLSMGDVVAVGAPLALAIGRIGCFLEGHNYGIPAPDLPWAVVYTHPNSFAPLNTPIHPTPLYHLLWNLIVFVIVWRLREKFKSEGSLMFLSFYIFAAGDFAIRFLRADEPVLLWGLRQSQVLHLIVVAIFLSWLIIRMRRFKKQASVVELANETELVQNREG
jgi:phosphatidylglycerol:prolipoprotein diacylglycerol transferase